jgi:hypothetical protein
VGGAAAIAHRGRASFGELVLRLRRPVPDAVGPTRVRVRARGIEAAAVVELPPFQPLSLEIVGARINGVDVRPDSSSGVRVVHVDPGDSLVGELALRYTAVVNEETIVLGYTPTWGDPSSAYRFVERLQGPAVNAPVAFTFALEAPRTPGRYFVVVAVGLETDAAYLFSGTNWVVGRPIWGDGNDIARWPAESIVQAARSGRVRHLKAFLITGSEGRRVEVQRESLGASAVQVVVRTPQ